MDSRVVSYVEKKGGISGVVIGSDLMLRLWYFLSLYLSKGFGKDEQEKRVTTFPLIKGI